MNQRPYTLHKSTYTFVWCQIHNNLIRECGRWSRGAKRLGWNDRECTNCAATQIAKASKREIETVPRRERLHRHCRCIKIAISCMLTLHSRARERQVGQRSRAHANRRLGGGAKARAKGKSDPAVCVRKRVANTCAALNIKRAAAARLTSIPNARPRRTPPRIRHTATHSHTRARPLFFRRRRRRSLFPLFSAVRRKNAAPWFRLRKFWPGKMEKL